MTDRIPTHPLQAAFDAVSKTAQKGRPNMRLGTFIEELERQPSTSSPTGTGSGSRRRF